MATAEIGHSPGAEASEKSQSLFMEWVVTEGAWYATSFVFHMLLMCVLMVASTFVKNEPPAQEGEAPSFEEAKVDPQVQDAKIEKFEVGETPIEPTELNTETLTLSAAPGAAEPVKAEYYDDSPVFSPGGGGGMAGVAASNVPNLGGLGGFNIKAFGPGPVARGGGGVGVGVGTGTGPGTGGSGTGFGGRGTGSRKALVGGFGGTRASERSVAAALNWLARHQMRDGSWSINKYQVCCKDPTCTGPGECNFDAAATALALLPFLAAGQTHKSKGPYQKTIFNGIYWMMKQQKPDGDLSGNANRNMYAHGLATIMMCEAYGLTHDPAVGNSAQAAVNFIQRAQHPRTGGWRYQPLQEGDTSVVGWQVMALKSAQMAYLKVNPMAFEGAKRWLKSVSKGSSGGLFCYTPESSPTPTMTSVGLLCSQYMGLHRDDPVMIEGMKYLMSNMPNIHAHNVYYWYYATQVLHNVPGPEWDTWNRQMRRVLIDSQSKEGCAAGSWDPAKPAKDAWATQGGRLMLTSLSALTLEVYYRYLPLYKLDSEAAVKSSKLLSKSLVEKTADQTVESAMAKPPSEMEKEKKAPEPKAPAKPADKPATPPPKDAKKNAK